MSLDYTPQQKEASIFNGNNINYGILMAVVAFVFTLILFFAKIPLTSWWNYLSTPIYLILLYLGIKSFRDKSLGGYMSFGKGFKGGAAISLIFGLVMTVLNFIYFKFINTNFTENMLLMLEEQFVKQGQTDEVIEQIMGIYEVIFQPIPMTLIGFFSALIMGLIFSLIFAAILKKEVPPSY